MDETEITTDEAGAILGVTPTQIGWYFRRGLLPGRRIGKRLLVFRRNDVESFEKPKKPGRPRKAPAPAPVPAPAPEPAAGKKQKKGPGRPKGKAK